MKYLALVLGTIAIVLAGVYVVAFTPFGNGMLKPLIEGKLQEQTKLESKLRTFHLNMHSFEIILELDSDNTLFINGTYSLFGASLDANYKVEINEIQNLQALTNMPSEGKLYTHGTLKGDRDFMQIDGLSDVALSNTSYHVELQEFRLTSIIAEVKDANLALLLKLGAQKAYADASVNLDVNFKNITPHALDGDIILHTKNGELNAQLMKKEFEINMPKSAFEMNLNAKLQGDDVKYAYSLSSTLANISSSGTVTPEPFNSDIVYDVNVKELAVLQPITGADIRGALGLSGTAKGTKEKLILDGKSDFASSNTTFEAIFNAFKLASLKTNMKNLELSKLFYMLKQPHYADGIFSLDLTLEDARSGTLQGSALTSIKNGVLNSDYMTKEYAFASHMPKTTFTLQTQTLLKGDTAQTKVDFLSSLAHLSMQKATLNFKDGSIESDYVAKIPNLDALYFVTQRHLKGDLSVHGTLKKAQDLDLAIHSTVAGGKVDAKLHNDDFHADLSALQTLELLDMLLYPKIFKSSLDGVFDYNLAQEKGTFKGNLAKGHFTENQVLSLAKQFAKVDLYKENFNGDVHAHINKENIVASLNLSSINASLKAKDTKLNSKTKKIESTIDIVANKNPISVGLSGDISAPKVTVNAEELIKIEAQKAVKKELGNILKGLF